MPPQTLLSLQHPLVKYLVALRKESSFRREEKKVVVIGCKIVEELANQKYPIYTLLVQEKTTIPFPAKETFIVSLEILKKITGLPNPEPLIAVVPMPIFQDLSKASYVLALDEVSDPGNVGTLLRSSLALGWEGVYLIDSCCDPFNDKALRAAKGATFRIPLAQGSFEDFLSFAQKKKMNVFLADTEGTPLNIATSKEPLALILSRESQGARKEAKSLFQRITIPMHGPMESLNVAAAGSILLYALRGII